MKKIGILLLSFLPLGFWAQAQTTTKAAKAPKAATPGPRDSEMVKTANAFLASLSEQQRKKATFAFGDEERFNWNFVPMPRQGLPLKEMTPEQRKQATALLQTALSEQGYTKAKAIMDLEVVLKALEKLPPENDRRDPEKYYFSIFGQPSEKDVWGWRVEGHHLSLNFSSITGTVASHTPAFMGSNPAIVPEGPAKGKQILKQEADLGFALVNMLSPEQLQKAMIADVAPDEIVTGNSRKAMLEKPVGILYSELTPAQQKAFTQLMNLYLDNYRKDLAQDLRSKVEKGGMGQMRFAWAGARQPVIGQAHYYRIHNPVLLIEYDNSQNNANHVHTVIRDLTNDFAEDALQKHYQKHPHKH